MNVNQFNKTVTAVERLINPCLARPVYIRLRSMQKSLNVKIIIGRCLAKPILQYWRCLLFSNINIFRHLKLEIASAIPASNDEN